MDETVFPFAYIRNWSPLDATVAHLTHVLAMKVLLYLLLVLAKDLLLANTLCTGCLRYAAGVHCACAKHAIDATSLTAAAAAHAVEHVPLSAMVLLPAMLAHCAS